MEYLDGKEPSIETLKNCIRLGTLRQHFVPVLTGSAFKNKGVQPLLDAVIDYMPAPTEVRTGSIKLPISDLSLSPAAVPPSFSLKYPAGVSPSRAFPFSSPLQVEAIKGILPNGDETSRASSDDEPFSALAFKIMNDPFVGPLTFTRVYSGVLSSGSTVLNSPKNKQERVGRMLEMHANSRTEVRGVSLALLLLSLGWVRSRFHPKSHAVYLSVLSRLCRFSGEGGSRR